MDASQTRNFEASQRTRCDRATRSGPSSGKRRPPQDDNPRPPAAVTDEGVRPYTKLSFLQQIPAQFSAVLLGSRRGVRRRILHILIKPAKHLVDQLFVRLHGGIPVRLVRKHHQASGAAVASNGLVELVRL